MIRVFLLVSLCFYAEVKLIQNPAQGFNSSDNYANRVIYFFLQKNTNGSVTLQVEPPPFYPFDQNYINAGYAYIDSTQVLQNYTAAEVAAATDVDISFTINAYANKQISNGYDLFVSAYEWEFFLDPRSNHYYQLQQFNNAAGTNPSIGGSQVFSDVLGVKHWVSDSNGVFLTESELDGALVQVRTPATNTSHTFTIRIDFTQLSDVPSGIYSLFFFVQMSSVPSNQSFYDNLVYYADAQTTQINYLGNNIIWMNGYLVGSSTLYDPSAVDRAIVVTNRTNLINQYNDLLTNVTAQWTAFAATPGLDQQSKTLIAQMFSFLETAEANKANF